MAETNNLENKMEIKENKAEPKVETKIEPYTIKTVKVRGEDITIEYIKNPYFPLKRIYSNKKTRALDKEFNSYSEALQLALESLTRSNLASIEIQNIVSYYLDLRKKIGKFFGFNEKEFIQHIEKAVKEGKAPCSSPGLNKALERGYFNRIKVKKKDIIFPYNL